MNPKLPYMVRAGLLTAMICLLTAVLHIPTPNGYIHCGDAIIYVAAVTLPLPYAVGAAAVGGAMADFLTGYVIYILPTFLIKGCLAFCFGKIAGTKSVSFPRRLTACILCGAVSISGYWLAAVVIYGNPAAQFLDTVPANAVQALASALLYFAVAAALERDDNAKAR